jgi:SAM-dependent methyltransferase
MVTLKYPGACVNGIDPAEGMVKVASRSFAQSDKARIVCGSVEKMSFENSQFDLVMSSSSINHWKNQGLGLAEIGRVTSPGGFLVIADNFAAGAVTFTTALLLGKRSRIRKRKEFDEMLKTAGFVSPTWKTIVKLGPFAITHVIVARRIL